MEILLSADSAQDDKHSMYEEVVTTQSTPIIWYILLAVLVIAAIIALAYFVYWIGRRLSRPELAGLTREEVQRRWVQVRETSKMNGQMGRKLALVEADNLLDSSLKSVMMPGETLGERLKMACYKYPKLKNVWWAHKLRNQLVHDSSFALSAYDAEKALNDFEAALKAINIL